jgi:hypothetical protein
MLQILFEHTRGGRRFTISAHFAPPLGTPLAIHRARVNPHDRRLNLNQERIMPTQPDRPQTKGAALQKAASKSPPSPEQQKTPPKEARTDRDRGTGELGSEALDPSKPIKKRDP